MTATQLYGPYGGVRYQSGTLPTSEGYTGQRADAATSGLDYYGARYYDLVAGQFTSADTLLPESTAQPDPGQLNRYAYVAGNPETKTDPNGHSRSDLIGGIQAVNSLLPWLQGAVGFGKGLTDSRSVYMKMAKARAWKQYKAAKNEAIAEKHAEGQRGGLSKAELQQLADERNAKVSTAEDTFDALDGGLQFTKWLGRGLLVAGVAADLTLSFANQWNQDSSGDYTTGQRFARAGTASLIHAGIDTGIGIGTAFVVEWGVTALAGILFAETGPADPLIMVAAMSLTTAVVSGGGAALITSALTPTIDNVSDWAVSGVGSWFS